MAEKILVIDDENDVLLILRTSLESAGYTVVTASNGIDALALAREEKPDLILLDLMMPEMSGEEVLEEIRSDPTIDTTKVVVLTALSEDKKIQELLDRGANYYLCKPFEYHDIITRVRQTLDDDFPGL